MRRSLAPLAALALLLGGAGQARADLVVNGGFETGDFSGWTVSDINFAHIVGNGLQHSGNFAAQLGTANDISTVSLDQNIATTAGHTYSLSFWLANDGGTFNEFIAAFNGVITDMTLPTPQGYTHYTFDNLVAAGDTTTLVFIFSHDSSFFRFDDVSLVDTTVTPEPASLTMLGIGVLGAAGYALRRRKRAEPAAC
jgi:hypothetical protein